MVLLLFFSVAQAAVLFFIKKHPSFAESKWMFFLLESGVVFVTMIFYIYFRKTEPKQESVASSLQKVPEKITEEKSKKEDREEIFALKSSLQQVNQEKEALLSRIEDLVNENEVVCQKLLHEEDLRQDIQKNTMRHAPFIRTLSNEIEKISEYIEEIKRQHALEIRVLLGKEEKNKKKESALPRAAFRVSSSPIASALHLLSRIHTGLALQEKANWPAAEHALLVRRKIFDIALTYSTTPFAILSSQSPSDSFLSEKILEITSLQKLTSFLSLRGEECAKNPPFYPFFFEEENVSWIVFHIMDDLFFFIPSACYTHYG